MENTMKNCINVVHFAAATMTQADETTTNPATNHAMNPAGQRS